MSMSSLILRAMEVDDIPAAMRLSVAEGWNQAEDDWKLFIEHAQNICMLAICDNKIIGTTTAINYANELAWIAMVLVDKEYRGQGISKLLLENVLRKLDSFTSIKLDATSAGQQVYRKFGFKEEYLIARMINPAVKNVQSKNDDQVMQVQPEDIPGIIALDKIVFGVDRSILVRSLITQYPHKAWVLKHDEMIKGFALGRNGFRYHHIGPVVAATPGDAKTLVIRALKELHDRPVVVDVLSDKEDLRYSLRSMGFEKQREFIRMYKNENLFPGNADQYYLICGPEFG